MEDFFMDQLIDKIDINILRHLQKDGRLTNAELSEKVNISAATCHRRTQRLFKDGYISSVQANINPESVGHGALVMVGVVLDRSTKESFRNFEAAIVKLPFVLDCHLTAGDFDYLLKIRVRDLKDFSKLHGDKLLGLPGVSQTRTFFVMKEVIDNARLSF